MDIAGRLDAAAIPGVSNPGRVAMQPGGAGLNMASNAARLGLACTLASPIGEDAHGATLRETLQQRGIGDALVSLPQAATGTYTAIIEPDGQMVIGLADLAIYERIDADWFFAHCRQKLEAAELWCISANLSEATLLEIAKRRSGRVLACATISPAKAVRLRSLLAEIDLLFTNRREAAALTGLANAGPQALVEALCDAGVRNGTISDGEN